MQVAGDLESITMRFQQNCERSAPALRGKISWATQARPDDTLRVKAADEAAGISFRIVRVQVVEAEFATSRNSVEVALVIATRDGCYADLRRRPSKPRPPRPESSSHAAAGSGTGAMLVMVPTKPSLTESDPSNLV